MTNRVVLCFDGTWNRPDNNAVLAARVETNVCRFYEAVSSGTLPGGDIQKKWYDTGVGTNWYDRMAGGSFGVGIDQKIRDGYQWLAENSPAGSSDNEIFILGFSRGEVKIKFLGVWDTVGALGIPMQA